MYIRRAQIEDVRCVEQFEWDLGYREDLSGWHVLLGDNGSGKTTILRCLALGLFATDEEFWALRESWRTWVRDGQLQAPVTWPV